MRTIIKITKQEAIDAWKDMNYEKVRDKDVTVEIEENQIVSLTGTQSTPYPPTPYPLQGGNINC